jgi:hypothetical protein
MMEVASLATFAATSNAVSNDQAVELAEKKSALLTTLTAVMDKRDPAAMANSLAAAAAVSKGNASLTPAGGAALLDVVDGMVSASSNARSATVSKAQVRGVGPGLGVHGPHPTHYPSSRVSITHVRSCCAAHGMYGQEHWWGA